MEGLRPEWTVKLIVAIVAASILFRCASAATNHSVGGVSGWDLSSNLQAWTSETTFHVGDSLVFSYTPVHDVVEVDHDRYQSCDTSSPIATHNDGETVVPLGQEGSRYFICGRQGHCGMGLKLQVQVLSPQDDSEQRTGGKKLPPSEPDIQPPSSPHSGSPPGPHCGVLVHYLMALATAVVIIMVAS